MTLPRTTWANGVSPITGKVPLREVPIPVRPKQRKGRTKYDEDFERLVEGKTAIEVHEDNFQTLRRALQRFIVFRQLTGQVSVRQQINPQTRMVSVWLERREGV